MKRPVILYGPPAVGKDTVTKAVTEEDEMYRLFPLLKAGNGKTVGYRMVSKAQLYKLELVISWQRYGNIYAIDYETLTLMAEKSAPILHLGAPERVRKVHERTPELPWLIVGMECPRAIAEERLFKRNAADVADRLRAFDETPPLADADLRIDTSRTDPATAARVVLAHATGRQQLLLNT